MSDDKRNPSDQVLLGPLLGPHCWHCGKPIAAYGQLVKCQSDLTTQADEIIALRKRVGELGIELQRYRSTELPGGWTEELNGQIQARHLATERAERAEATLRECLQHADAMDFFMCNLPTDIQLDARMSNGRTGREVLGAYRAWRAKL